MKKPYIVGIVFVAIIIGVSLLYIFTAPTVKVPAAQVSKSETASPAPTPSESASPAVTTEQTTVIAGSYVDYSSDKVASTSGTKLLFFHAPWCPQCRAIEKDIQSSTLPENVTIMKVDYDTNQALRQKYGVTTQTTFVKIDDQGNLVKKYVAYNQPTFAAVKQNLLN